MAKLLDLSGIFPPIPTPFNEDESIAYDKLKANLSKWEKIPFTGYVVHGSIGENPFLSADEKVEVVKVVKESVASGKLIIAGAGCECKLLFFTLICHISSDISLHLLFIASHWSGYFYF